MRQARKLSNPNRVNVTLYAAAYEDEAFAVDDALGFRKVPIHRSTMTEYPNLRPHKRLPMIQDIFQAVMDANRPSGCDKRYASGSPAKGCELGFDYFIYTNSDIGVHKSFYNQIESILRTDRLDAFSINRVGVPHVSDNGKPFSGTKRDLQKIFHFMRTKGQKHPGWDTFVVHRSLLERIDLGNNFLGYSG